MHLFWWSQKKNAPESGTRILHSKPFAVGEDTENIFSALVGGGRDF